MESKTRNKQNFSALYMCAGGVVLNMMLSSITSALALLLIRVIPEKYHRLFAFNMWLQNPLTDEEFPGRENTEVRKVSLRIKTLLVLVFSLTTVALVSCILSVRVYKKMSVNEHIPYDRGQNDHRTCHKQH